MMEWLAVPFSASAVVLAVGGGMKLADPRTTVGALRGLRLPHSPTLVRALAAAEAVLGAAALAFDSRGLAAGVALSYLAFAAFVAFARSRGGSVGSCGCLGRVDTPPTITHILVDLMLAAVAVAVAAADAPRASVATAFERHSLSGVPFVVVTIVVASIVLVAFTRPTRLRLP